MVGQRGTRFTLTVPFHLPDHRVLKPPRHTEIKCAMERMAEAMTGVEETG
jgi:hypothetical protein